MPNKIKSLYLKKFNFHFFPLSPFLKFIYMEYIKMYNRYLSKTSLFSV